MTKTTNIFLFLAIAAILIAGPLAMGEAFAKDDKPKKDKEKVPKESKNELPIIPFSQCDNDPPSGSNDGVPFLEIWDAVCLLKISLDDAMGDFQTQIDTLTNNLAAHVIADGDLDATNELELPCSGCVGSTEIENHSIKSIDIENAAVGSLQIEPGAVGTSQIENHSIKSIDIENAAVGSLQIEPGAVGALQMQNIQITTLPTAMPLDNKVGDVITSNCPVNQVMTGLVITEISDNVVTIAIQCTDLSTP